MSRFFSFLLGVFALSIPVSGAAESGFRPIFDGKSLAGWDGDPLHWSVKDGVLRGETTLGHLVLINTFLIWRGGTLKDFELQLKFRIQNGNSGVQYRSRDLGSWKVAGYQAEIDNAAGKTGFLYEERLRRYLALIGEKVTISPEGKSVVTNRFATKADLVGKSYYHPREWNDYRIVARGNHLQHFVNGILTIDVTDEDVARRALEGLLALQIHAGPPMLVEFKDILLKNL